MREGESDLGRLLAHVATFAHYVDFFIFGENILVFLDFLDLNVLSRDVFRNKLGLICIYNSVLDLRSHVHQSIFLICRLCLYLFVKLFNRDCVFGREFNHCVLIAIGLAKLRVVHILDTLNFEVIGALRSTRDAFGVPFPKFNIPKLHSEGIKEDHSSPQDILFGLSEHNLDNFKCLHLTD